MPRSFIPVVIFLLVFSVYAQDPTRSGSYNNKGLKLFKDGKFTEAIDAFTKAIESSSLLTTQKEVPVNNLVARGPMVAEQVTVIDPRTAAALVNRGNVYFAMGDLDSAMNDYDRAIRISPGLAEAYSCRGSIWLERGDPDRAIEDYSHAVKIDAKFVKGYLGRAMSSVTKGDTKSAFADLDAALNLSPKNAEIYYRRGDAYRIAGNKNAAFADYEAASRIDPNMAGPYFARGFIHYSSHEFESAVKYLSMAIDRESRMTSAFVYRGYALLALGREAEADSDFKRALAIQPQLRSDIEAGIKQIKSQ